MYSADHPFLFGKWKMPFRTMDLIVITFALLKQQFSGYINFHAHPNHMKLVIYSIIPPVYPNNPHLSPSDPY